MTLDPPTLCDNDCQDMRDPTNQKRDEEDSKPNTKVHMPTQVLVASFIIVVVKAEERPEEHKKQDEVH